MREVGERSGDIGPRQTHYVRPDVGTVRITGQNEPYNPADATFFVWVVLLATAGLCYPDVAKFRSPDARAKHVEYWTAKA